MRPASAASTASSSPLVSSSTPSVTSLHSSRPPVVVVPPGHLGSSASSAALAGHHPSHGSSVAAAPPVPSSSSNSSTTAPEIIEDRRPTPGRPNGRRYFRGKFLGKGGFAKVYEAMDMETREVCAVKIVQKASLVKQRAKLKLLSEIAIHKTLSCERVVKYLSHFDDAENVYIFLELCPNQTLNDLLRKKRRFTDAEAMYYVYELVQGLFYLRKQRVIHRDLKLGNLFLGPNMDLKIGDFGLAARLDYDTEKKTTICGTPNYIAPEILDNLRGHSYQVDMWSLGVVLFTMLVGKPPFEDADVKATYQRIRDNAYSFPENVYVSSNAKHLISSILKADPKLRPTPMEVLSHAWMRQGLPPGFTGETPCPPLPQSIASMNRVSTTPVAASITPRSGHYSATRSETPDAYQRDFARIDSPAPMFGTTAPRPTTAPSYSGAPVLRESRGNYAPSSGSSSRQSIGNYPAAYPPTPSASSSGLPSARNDENALPPNSARPRAPIVVAMGGGSSPKGRSAVPLASARSPAPVAAPSLHALMSPSVDLFAPPTVSRRGSLAGGGMPEAWVARWVDYSSKYGVGFALHNGQMGVYFNDATKMVLGSGGTVDYITRAKGERTDHVITLSLDDADRSAAAVLATASPAVASALGSDWKKKMTLVRNFRGYLLATTEKEGTTRGNSLLERSTADPSTSTSPVHVKRWLRTKHAIVFQLSTKVVFQDGTEVILSAPRHLSFFISAAADGGAPSVTAYPLSSIGDVTDEFVAKRLSYTKNIVMHMLGSSTSSGAAAATTGNSGIMRHLPEMPATMN